MLLLLVMLAGANACLQGFAGDPCERCVAEFACDENGTHACANRTHSMNGSRTCDIAEQPLVATSTRRVAVKRWWAHTLPNPSNASCGCYIMTNDVSVTLDAGGPILLGGVDIKGRDEAWVKSFQCSFSLDNVTWAPLGGVYQGNVENKKVVSVLFPYATRARFVKIHVVEYFKWPSFRAALLEALATTCPVGRVCRSHMGFDREQESLHVVDAEVGRAFFSFKFDVDVHVKTVCSADAWQDRFVMVILF